MALGNIALADSLSWFSISLSRCPGQKKPLPSLYLLASNHWDSGFPALAEFFSNFKSPDIKYSIAMASLSPSAVFFSAIEISCFFHSAGDLEPCGQLLMTIHKSYCLFDKRNIAYMSPCSADFSYQRKASGVMICVGPRNSSASKNCDSASPVAAAISRAGMEGLRWLYKSFACLTSY